MDLLQTGKYGVLSNQRLLGTTSTNITNVNTKGYTRQETQIYTSTVDWGVGSIVTRRMYDKYLQREVYRDQGNVGFYDNYSAGLSTVDNLLSRDDTSLSSSINNLFASMQNAVQNTTSVANRRDLLVQFDNFIDRLHTLNYDISNELKDNNARIDDTVNVINDLVKGIFDVNRQCRALSKHGEQTELGLQFLDQRDQLINDLSSLVDINVTNESDGSISVYLGNGQLLVNGDDYGTLHSHKSSDDPTRREASISFNNPAEAELILGIDTIGGKLGGLLNATDDIRQTMRDLGQLAIAFADAVNEQNKGGITLENQAGQDLLTKPTAAAMTNHDDASMVVSFDNGEGSDVRNADYKVVFDPEAPHDPHVYIVEGQNITELDPSIIKKKKGDHGELILDLEGHGITMTFNKSQEDLGKADDRFVVQPTLNAAFDIKSNLVKPEQFAFASAVRVNTSKHAGSAVATLNGVTSTAPGMGVIIGDHALPQLSKDAPNYVEYDEAKHEFVIYHVEGAFDSSGKPEHGAVKTRLGAASEDTCHGKSIFENAVWDTKKPDGFPGYDVSFVGSLKHGSSFFIEINKDGANDNSNGNLLSQLQQLDLVHGRTGDRKCSFTESYADLTANVGSAVMSAQTDLRAATAKCEQSQSLFSSTAGVNLDEEAASLLRYQQSYGACAKIISASQTIFDALLRSF